MLPLFILVAMGRMLLGTVDELLPRRLSRPRRRRRRCAHMTTTTTQDLAEDIDNGVSDLSRGGPAAEIARADLEPANVFPVQDLFHRLLDGERLAAHVETIPQHHGRGEDLRDGVDEPLARDVRRGAVRRLVDAVALTTVGDTT